MLVNDVSGSYEIRVEKPGAYQLKVMIDGAQVDRSPFQLSVTSGTTRAPNPFSMRAELNGAMAKMSDVDRMVLMACEFGGKRAPELAAVVGAEVRFVLRGLADNGAEMELERPETVVVQMRSAARHEPASVEALADGTFAVVFTPRARSLRCARHR